MAGRLRFPLAAALAATLLTACAAAAPPAGRRVPAAASLAESAPTPAVVAQRALSGVLWVDAAMGELWRIDAETGAAQRAAIPGGARATQPAVTPDCATQAWMTAARRADGAFDDRYGIAVQGAPALTATASFGYADPALSPDGRVLFATRLAFDGDGLRSDVVRVALDGAAAPQLIVADAVQPSVSPDGRRLVYVALDAANAPVIAQRLVVRDIAGGAESSLFPAGRFLEIFGPRWLDAERIVFAALEDESVGRAPTPLDVLFGASIARAHSRAGHVWVVRADGSDLRRLTAEALESPVVAPAPDGSAVAVLADESVYAIGIDDAAMRRIVDVGGGGGLAWCRAQ